MTFKLPKQKRKTMTLNITEKEMSVLEQMSMAKDISKTGIMRQALRMYQMVDVRMSRGETMIWCDKDGNRISEALML